MGANDIVMPGTFLTPEEEMDLLRRVEADPPALVIWPNHPYDRDPAKSLEHTCPRLARWVLEHYQRWGMVRRHYLMGPRGQAPPSDWGPEHLPGIPRDAAARAPGEAG